MRFLKYIVAILSVLIVLHLTAQDRNTSEKINLPANMLLENGGRAIDVTASPFNAKGDGETDDTQALIAAYNWLVNKLDGPDADFDPDKSYFIYLPNGEYLVSNTIIYDGSPILGHWYTSEGLSKIRFIGQSRDSTIIRLKNNSAGYEVGKEKAVLSFGKMDFNNIFAKNAIRNLTVNTGSGNPGAVGIRMAGANNAGASNLLIKSEDGNSNIGLDFSIAIAVGYYRDITIDGFKNGIRLTTEDFVHPVLEHISILNSIESAFLFEDVATATIRKLYTNGPSPAIKTVGKGCMPTIVDSELINTSGGEAINLDGGYLFARNINTSGTGCSIYDYTETHCLLEGNITEFVSQPIVKTNNNVPDNSLNLPIKDAPLVWQNDTNSWVSVDDYGAIGDGVTDDSEAIQAAFNSGKAQIYFPKFQYRIDNSIYVPSTVKCIAGMFSYILGNAGKKFIIDQESQEPVVFLDLRIDKNIAIVQASQRVIVMDNITGFSNPYRNEYPGSELYVNNCTGFRYTSPFKNTTAWVRFINTEAKNTQFLVDNSEVVVLGFKTEKHYASFEAKNNSQLEVLGGLANQQAWDDNLNNPIFINNNSDVSFNAATCRGFTEGFDLYIKDGNKSFYKEIFPVRDDDSEYIRAIPLYVNHESIQTSIKQKPSPVLRAFPNPVHSEVLNIELADLTFSYCNISIFNMMGQCVHKELLTNPKLTIDVKSWPQGAYLLSIKNGASLLSQRIIIKK